MLNKQGIPVVLRPLCLERLGRKTSIRLNDHRRMFTGPATWIRLNAGRREARKCANKTLKLKLVLYNMLRAMHSGSPPAYETPYLRFTGPALTVSNQLIQQPRLRHTCACEFRSPIGAGLLVLLTRKLLLRTPSDPCSRVTTKRRGANPILPNLHH